MRPWQAEGLEPPLSDVRDRSPPASAAASAEMVRTNSLNLMNPRTLAPRSTQQLVNKMEEFWKSTGSMSMQDVLSHNVYHMSDVLEQVRPGASLRENVLSVSKPVSVGADGLHFSSAPSDDAMAPDRVVLAAETEQMQPLDLRDVVQEFAERIVDEKSTKRVFCTGLFWCILEEIEITQEEFDMKVAEASSGSSQHHTVYGVEGIGSVAVDRGKPETYVERIRRMNAIAPFLERTANMQSDLLDEEYVGTAGGNHEWYLQQHRAAAEAMHATARTSPLGASSPELMVGVVLPSVHGGATSGAGERKPSYKTSPAERSLPQLLKKQAVGRLSPSLLGKWAAAGRTETGDDNEEEADLLLETFAVSSSRAPITAKQAISPKPTLLASTLASVSSSSKLPPVSMATASGQLARRQQQQQQQQRQQARGPRVKFAVAGSQESDRNRPGSVVTGWRTTSRE